jgi:hypothetical protein
MPLDVTVAYTALAELPTELELLAAIQQTFAI